MTRHLKTHDNYQAVYKKEQANSPQKPKANMLPIPRSTTQVPITPQASRGASQVSTSPPDVLTNVPQVPISTSQVSSTPHLLTGTPQLLLSTSQVPTSTSLTPTCISEESMSSHAPFNTESSQEQNVMVLYWPVQKNGHESASQLPKTSSCQVAINTPHSIGISHSINDILEPDPQKESRILTQNPHALNPEYKLPTGKQVPTSTPKLSTGTPQASTITPVSLTCTSEESVNTSHSPLKTEDSQEQKVTVLKKLLQCKSQESASQLPNTSGFLITMNTSHSIIESDQQEESRVPTKGTSQVKPSAPLMVKQGLTITPLTPTCTSKESIKMNTHCFPINTEHLLERNKEMILQQPKSLESASQLPKASGSQVSMNTTNSINNNLEPDQQEGSGVPTGNPPELNALNPEYKVPEGKPMLLYKCPVCPHVIPSKHYFTQHLETHPTPTQTDNVDEILLAKTVSFEGEIYSVCPLCHVLCAPNKGIMKHLQTHNDNTGVVDSQLHLGPVQEPIETELHVSRKEHIATCMKKSVHPNGSPMFLPSLGTMVTKVKNSKGHNIFHLKHHEKESNIPTEPIEPLKCPFCQKLLPDSLLELHLKTVHELYMCTNCPRTFQSTSALNQHSAYCFKKPKYECLHCYCAFTSNIYLIRHIRKNHLWCQCVTCKKVFQSKEALTEHNNKEHPNNKGRPLTDDGGIKRSNHEYICIDCRAVFLQWEQLEKHMLTECSLAVGGVLCEEGECGTHSVKFKCMCSLLKHIRKKHTRKYASGSAEENEAISVAIPGDTYSYKDSAQCCGSCGTMWASQEDLAQHVLSVHCNKEAESVEEMNNDGSTNEIKPQAGCLGKPSDVMSAAVKTQQGIKVKPMQRNYICKYCQSTFESLSALNDHWKSCLKKVKTFECPHCYSDHLFEHDLLKHIRKNHMWIYCTKCDELFQSIEEFQQHKSTAHSDSTTLNSAGGTCRDHSYICMDCQRTFVYSAYLENHLLRKCTMRLGEIRCQKCKTKFKCKCSLLQHTMQNQKEIDSQGKDCTSARVSLLESASPLSVSSPQWCGTCGEICASDNDLTQHIDSMHSASIRIGSTGHDSDSNLIIEKEAKAKESEFELLRKETILPSSAHRKHADEVEVNSNSVITPREDPGPCAQVKTAGMECIDMNRKNQIKSFKCNLCPLTCFSECRLKVHIQTVHRSVSTLKASLLDPINLCVRCQKEFASQTDLNHHSEYCVNREIFECLHCDSRHTFQYYLIKHIREHHLWLQCPSCPEVYQSRKGLDYHKRTGHSSSETRQIQDHVYQKPVGVGDYVCVDCETLFVNRKQLENHMLIRCSEDVREVQCRECLAKFKCKCSLLQHTKRNHPSRNAKVKNTRWCGTCAQMYASENDLAQHIAYVHSESGRKRNEGTVSHSTSHPNDQEDYINEPPVRDSAGFGTAMPPVQLIQNQTEMESNTATKHEQIESGFNVAIKEPVKTKLDVSTKEPNERKLNILTQQPTEAGFNVSQKEPMKEGQNVATEEPETGVSAINGSQTSELNMSREEPAVTYDQAKQAAQTELSSNSVPSLYAKQDSTVSAVKKKTKKNKHKHNEKMSNQGSFKIKQPSFKCSRCSVRCFSKCGLQVHIKSHRTLSPLQPMERRFKCSSQISLKSHSMYCLQNVKSYECLHCSNQYPLKDELIAHIRQTHLWLPCPKCPQIFHSRQELEGHMGSQHSNCKEGMCETLADVNTHQSPQDYICVDCFTVLPHSKQMEYHLLTKCASRIKAITCWKCMAKFKCRCSCMAHIQQSHSEYSISSSNKCPRRCGYCGVKYSNGEDLAQHIASVHSRQTDKELQSSPQIDDILTVNMSSSYCGNQEDSSHGNSRNHGKNGSKDDHQDGIISELSSGVMLKQSHIETDSNTVLQQGPIGLEVNKEDQEPTEANFNMPTQPKESELNVLREEAVVTALTKELAGKAAVSASPISSLESTLEGDLMRPALGGKVKGHNCNAKKSTNTTKCNPSFECNLCSVAYLTKSALKLHVKARHSSVPLFRKILPKPVSKSQTCLHCLKTFENEAYFQTHSLLCSINAKSDLCVHCDSKIAQRSQLILHIRRNHLWMLCGKCGEVYQSMRELAEHKRKEHSRTETVRDVTFNTAEQGSITDQQYICVDCQTVFHHRRQIEEHLLTKCNMKLRIVRCRKCNARFKCRCSLLQHRRQYHSGYSDGTLGLKRSFYKTPQQCESCGQVCSSGNDLVQHIVSEHSGRVDKDGESTEHSHVRDNVNHAPIRPGNYEPSQPGSQETENYRNHQDDLEEVVSYESITGESAEMHISDVRTLSDTFNGLSESKMPRQEPAELQSNVVVKQEPIDSGVNVPIQEPFQAGVKEQNMDGQAPTEVNSMTQSTGLYKVEKLFTVETQRFHMIMHKKSGNVTGTNLSTSKPKGTQINVIKNKIILNSPFVRSYVGRPTMRHNMIQEAKHCPLCHKSFSKRHLGKHIREKCHKAFLRKHIMREHSYAKRREQSYAKRKIPNLEASLPDWLTDNTESSETSMFRCALCNRLCVSHKSLGRHMRKVHVRQECYKCPNCAKVFTMRESLRQHRRVHSTNRSLSIIQRVRNAQLLKMANRKKVRCRGYLSMIKKLWKRNRKIYYYNRKRSTTIKRCTILRAYSRCLMCLKWYRGIEQHLWKCQAKRPCLKRIIEIYTEIKQEPKDEYEEALVDHKQPVEGDQFVSSNYVQPLVALQGHTEEPLELKLELENDQPSKLEQPFRTGEQPLEAGEPPNLSLEEGPEDDDPPLLTPEEHDVKSDQLLQTSVPPVLAHEQPFTTLEQTFKIEEPPTLVRKQPEYTHEQSDQPILAYKQAKVEMKLESEEELIEEQEELVEPNLEVQDVMDSKAYRKCMMCLHWVCEIEDHLWVCQAKRQCLTRISIVEVKSKIKEVPIKPQQELVEKVELTKPLESVLDSQSLMNEVDKKVHAKCLLCLIQLSEVELANHLWTCEAKRPCLNKVTISTV